MKNPFKKLKKKLEAPAPRQLDEIQREYSDISAKAGNAQYLTYIYQNDLQYYNQRMRELNHEADLRKKLNAEVAKAAAAVQETKAVSEASNGQS